MRSWLVGLCIALSLAVPMAAEAATSCTCFCGTATDGAVQLPKTFTDSKECITACRDESKEVVGCFQREDQYPEHSELCWTVEQCEGGTEVGKGNDWHNDVPECDDRKQPMGYCYAAPRSVTTMIAISGDSTFAGLAEYIDALYRYLVPTMAVVAVVMVMIAGLQYILSRGNPSAVKQAKERIVKAVVGIILLLSAYTLAYLLDPRLVEFTQLRIPKVKQVVLLSTGSQCETLALAGIEVDNVKAEEFVDKTCSFETGAVQGVVTDIANVKDNVDIGGWKEQDKCNYSLCDSGAVCTSRGCIECSDVASHALVATVDTVDSDVSVSRSSSGGAWGDVLNNIYADDASCEMISDPPNGKSDAGHYCIYSLGGSTLESIGVITGGRPAAIIPGILFTPSCVEMNLECTQVQSEALALKNAGQDVCSVYGEQWQEQASTNLLSLGQVTTVGPVSVEAYAQVIDVTVYKKVCDNDPCKVGALQSKTCVFTTTESGGVCAGR